MMKVLGKLVLTLAIFKIVNSSRSERSDSGSSSEEEGYLKDYLTGILEIFRDNMKEGIPSLKIPPLDPLESGNINVKVKEGLIDADIDIIKITVVGLSTFQINDFKPEIDNLQMRLNVTFPQVEAFGQYKLRGNIAIIFPLTGNGDFQLKFTKATITAVAQFQVVDDILQLKDLDLNADFEQMEIYLENFLGRRRFSDMVKKMMPVASKNLYDRFRPSLRRMLEEELKQRFNKELQKEEFQELLQPFMPAKEESEY